MIMFRIPMKIFAHLFWAVAAILSAACESSPVQWSEVRYSLAGTAGAPVRDTTDSSAVPDSAEDVIPIPDSAACHASVRVARAGKSFYAVWWSARKDSSATLLTSRSDDGGAWGKAVIADSSDASRRGCARPAPAIAADLVNGYVHLAYFIEPSSGAGVFSVHTMDRGESFHAAVPLVFGARPSATSVSAEGDKVAVAYEEPNGARPEIFVALSRTMGHLFELKLPVSEGSGSAENPTVVVRGTKLVVGWTELNPPDSTRERHTSRTGTWK